MARLNIEDCWWTDPRRSALVRLVGETRADGCVIRAWRLGQEFWKNGRNLVPKHLFDCLDGATELVQAGLADVRESLVYVRGSSAHLEWTAVQRENAKAAGKASADSRREKEGTAQPKPRTTPEQAPNDSRTDTNTLEPSVSVSVSVSGSKKKSNTARTGVRAAYSPEFEAVWEAYGKHGKKSDASKAFQELALTPEEYDNLQMAITPYLKDCKACNRTKQYMGTFLREDWRVWLDKAQATPRFAFTDMTEAGMS